MIQRHIEKWSSEQKKALFDERAIAFHARLTPAQYLERNRHIYAVPFAKQHIHTYVLLDEAREVLSSCELLEVDFAKRAEGGIEKTKGVMIAAVVTPSKYRGAGHCTFLLKEVFRLRGPENRILFSDIDPAFYSRLGFALGDTMEWDIHFTSAGSLKPGVPLSLSDFTDDLTRRRLELLQTELPGAVTLIPSVELLNWHVERYRAFHAIKERVFPTQFAWQLRHCEGEKTHLVFAIPNPITESLDCMWVTAACSDCMDFAKAVARSHNLGTLTMWSKEKPEASAEGHVKNPMLQVPDFKEATLLDAQPCDYW